MAVSVGTRVGAYEIVAVLGAGGMGEVYRARDHKLNRDVAIKVLLPEVANDPERLARFRREAQVLASLNHPNIAHIHGLEDSDGITAIVMELVDGPTLADRVAQGPMPTDDVIPIACQIAEALEAAHDQGIVHRDLKPANIKVRADGTVKVLDFGLAKALDPLPGTAAGAAMANSPTLTSPAMTHRGVILGTSAYMSPEQAKGLAADKRSDVWAFGCVLYEMLSGKRAFEGEDVSETLATVIKGDVDWGGLPANTPQAFRTLLRGCLRKNKKERIGDVSTARFVLNEANAITATATAPVASRSRSRGAILVIAGVLIGAIGAAAALWNFRPRTNPTVARFAVSLPPGQILNANRRAIAVSPDGSRIVYSANGRLFVRSMSELEPREISGTGVAVAPEFSPDGRSIVFWGDSLLKRVLLDNAGPATTICDVGGVPASISWTDAGIVFTEAGSGNIMRVSPNGGKPEVLVDLSKSDEGSDGPQLLPDGRTLLFAVAKRAAASIDRWDRAQIVVQEVGTSERKMLIDGGSHPKYLPTGHLLYLTEGTMFAVPFDAGRRAVTGGAVPVVPGVSRVQAAIGAANFAASRSGAVAYVPGGPLTRHELVVFERAGAVQALKLPPGTYLFPRAAPDGKRVAFETSDSRHSAISIYDLSGENSPRRLTFDRNNRFPVWSADGRRIAFQSDREGDLALFWQPADGGTAERLTKPAPGAAHAPESWSPDGRVLLFSELKDSVWSLWTYSLPDRKTAPFSDVRGSQLPTNAAFSPDGRWVAYQVGERAQSEGMLYVQPFPPTGSRYQIGRGGRPAWSRDGKELFFVPAPAQFVSVRITPEPFSFSTEVAIPRRFGIADPTNPRPFDTLPDGRFVGVAVPGLNQSGAGPAQIQVILNWFEELKARVPTK